MRTRSVIFQGVLAAIALAAACFVSLREPEGAPGEVVVLDAPVSALERVRHEDASGGVELYREPSEDGALWLRLGTRELRANADAVRLFSRFAPLRASRSLGVLDAEHLAEVGLKDSARVLRVFLSQGEQAFRLAAPASGWRGPYLWRESDGQVFLLSASLLPDLENAAHRLVDRSLHAFGAGEYDTLSLTMPDGASRAFRVQTHADRPASLVPLDAPGAPDEAARRWHERITLLAPAAGDFLGRGEAPPGGPPHESFRVEYGRGGTHLGHLTVARGADGVFYVRTEHTPGWARLAPWAGSLVEEARRVVLTPTGTRP